MRRPRNATDDPLRLWFDSMLNHDGPIQPNMTTPCWEWTGPLDRKGYGRLWFKGVGRHMGAHRVAWTLANGDPGPLCVLHRCDNPKCCREDGHLFTGTKADNNADRSAKGRSAYGDRNGQRVHPERTARGDRSGPRLHPERMARGDKNGRRLHPERWPRGDQHHMRLRPELVMRGEDNKRARLTEDDVREIRRLRAAGVRIGDLAKQFGVGRTTIGHLLAGDTWTHVPLE